MTAEEELIKFEKFITELENSDRIWIHSEGDRAYHAGTTDLFVIAKSYAKQAIKDMLDVSDEQIYNEGTDFYGADTDRPMEAVGFRKGMKAFRDKLKEEI